MVVLKYGNIRDIPMSDIDSLWKEKAYNMWTGIWRRVYGPGYAYWKDCEIYEDFRYISKFLKWIESQPRFEEFCSTCGEVMWVIDKDIKSPGNKKYFPEYMTLTTQSENCKERLSRCGSPMSKKPIIAVNIKDGKMLYIPSVNDLKILKFHKGSVRDCCIGIKPSYKGYKWYYLDIIEL